MQPAKEITHKTIGLIAGQGTLPDALVARWESNGLTPVIVGLKGITPPALLNGRVSAEFSIGQAGHILSFFKSNGVTELVMVGGLKRPNFWTLRTDFLGMTIVAKLLCRKVGDDGLLKFIRREIETFGIHVVGVHEFLPEILCPSGVLGKHHPTDDDLTVIADGFRAAKQHGADDKGQSIIVNANGVCGFEGAEGTNALIHSCHGAENAILVKVSKPQQDLAFDMPTIGLSTVDAVLKSGLKGIAVETGKTIILDRDEVVRKCDENGLFIMGREE
jgi:DUF1009 family protein